MIEESKVDIDYEQLHSDRRNLSVSERQMDRVGGSYQDRLLIDGGHILAPWNVPVSVLASNRRTRMRFWIIVMVVTVTISLISFGVLFWT